MGRPNQIVQVYSNARATFSTGRPSNEKITTGWPVGDTLLKSLMIRIRSVVSAATAMVTDGRLEFLRALTLSTDKHGPIIEGLDGHALRAVGIVRGAKGNGPYVSGATVDEAHYLQILLANLLAARPEDTVLDLLKSTPTLELEFGNAADIESTGSTTLDNVDVDVDAEIDPGPVDIRKDGPMFMPHFSVIKFPVNATATPQIIDLPYGDRILERIYLCQRNGSTLAVLNNTVITAASKIELKVNNFSWLKTRQDMLQERNDQDYAGWRGIMRAQGVSVIDLQKLRAGGAMKSDALSVLDDKNGTCKLEIGVTAVTNGQLWIVMESSKPIPQGALRPAPEPQKG